jgi:LysR family pca operon transcriptional activator
MIRIERKHLAMVTTIAQAGTMTAAADALAITQPALSKQLAQLEAMLGVKLFERTAKSSATAQMTMRLTRAGRRPCRHRGGGRGAPPRRHPLCPHRRRRTGGGNG